MLTTLLKPTNGTMLVNGCDPVSEQDAERVADLIMIIDRGALIGQVHFGFGIDLAVLCGVSALFLVVGSYLFSKIQV